MSHILALWTKDTRLYLKRKTLIRIYIESVWPLCSSTDIEKLKASEQQQAMSIANANFINQLCKELKKRKHAKLFPNIRKVLK